jgi:nucleoside-triphosphatase THEP1
MVRTEINDYWIKASILGTLWAASEIVLGSFLHNLKIPFSGNLLTSIGIIILISVSYIWTDRGLFWRSGLICAIMKTMSPSAVIFGPMIAIFSEALLLEISVRLLGKTIAGYMVGAMLAMSWNLFQKIANFIIFYGFNIVGLYTNLIKFAQKQLNIRFDIVWLPPVVLLILYCILGIIAAYIGIRIGRRMRLQPSDVLNSVTAYSLKKEQNDIKQQFNYSMIWLIIDLILIIGALVLLNFSSLIYWSIPISAIVAMWAFRYKRALRQLSKPKFWIFFVLITMLTAFVFTRITSDTGSLKQGLLLGLQMNFRAVIIIVGFSVLGTELYNPRIREFFLKTSFKQLPLALELSFESLPSMISNIPELKTIIRNPVSVFYQIISQVNFRLAELKDRINARKKIFILTGTSGQGKTTMIREILNVLKENKIPAGGIYSPKVIENNKIIGYDLVDIMTGEREIFLRDTADFNSREIGRFAISPLGLTKGKNALGLSVNAGNEIVIIDEVGNLELNEQGWAGSLNEIISASKNHVLLVVRDIFVGKIIKKWNLKEVIILNIAGLDHLKVSKLIMNDIR